jgi:hypothetical protein
MSEESTPQSMKKMVSLASEAHHRFEIAAGVNQSLLRQDHGQKVILEDLSQSLREIDDLEKSIDSRSEELDGLTLQVRDAQGLLLEALTTNSSEPTTGPSSALKTILSRLQQSIMSLTKAGVDSGSLDISLLPLIQLEDELGRISQDMSERGLFPESDEARSQRLKLQAEHGQRVLSFLEELESASKSTTDY